MAEDLANNPAPAEPTAAAPELATTPEIEIDPESEGQPVEGQAVEDDLEEIEVDGKKGKVSKSLKDGYLRQADYTRKTQEAAEKAKAAEAKEAALAEQTQTFQRHAKDVAKLMAVAEEVEAYEKVDWERFAAERPADCQAVYIKYQNKLRERDTIAQTLNAQEREWQLKAQQETAKRIEEGRKAIAAQIPGWSTELDNKLSEHATSYGFTKDEWSGVHDPRAVKVLHDAYQYRQLVAKQQRAANPTVQPVQPIPQVGGQRTVSSDLRSLASREDPSAFIAARNKQVGRR